MAPVAIGLGSNLNRPLQQLRQAIHLLKQQPQIQIQAYSSIYRSPALVPADAPPAWRKKPYLNAVIRIETSLSPQDLLLILKKIEIEMGRVNVEKWAPRPIDLDILIYDGLSLNTPSLTLPHPEIDNRPFVIAPLQEVWPEVALPIVAEDQLEKLPHLLDGPQMVGILNITPDSFSDGNCFVTPESALAQAKQLFKTGADIIDIGAESTRPGATLIDAEREWQRLAPVLQYLHAEWSHLQDRPLISLDTRHVQTIAKALGITEIDWINDQGQAEFEQMTDFLKNNTRRYVVMHHLCLPPKADIVLEVDPIQALQTFQQKWQQRFVEKGLSQAQLILDPGIGFGKTRLQQLDLLRRFAELTQKESAWLVGHSRKSFLSVFEQAGKHDLTREICTALISTQLAKKGVAYLRVHEPAASLAAIRLTHLFQPT